MNNIFDKEVEKKIVTSAILSFMGPPMGWMMIIIVSRLLDFDGLTKVLLNINFYLYCTFFLAVNVWRNKQIIKKIQELTIKNEFDKLNQFITKIPYGFFIFTFIYGFLGPPAVTLGLGFNEHVFYICWILGPVVIFTFSIPFFNHYMILIDKYASHIPMSMQYYSSIRSRFNTSIVFLVLGVMTMLSVVFYNIYVNYLNGMVMSLSEIKYTLVFFTFIGVSIVGVPLLIQTRILKKNLDNLKQYVFDLKEGKLGEKFTVDQRDELGIVMTLFIQLSNNFNDIVKHIQEDSQLLSRLEKELQISSSVIASESENQVQNSQSTFDSVNQLQSEITDTTSRSSAMEINAGQVNNDVRIGIEELNKLVSAVNNVNHKLKLIDEITRQTNMLAINATIEASNAGEQGLSFAVIANEVRSLAEQSKQNSIFIKEEIEGIQEIASKTKEIFDVIGPLAAKNGENSKFIKEGCIKQEGEMNNISQMIANLDYAIKAFDTNAHSINKHSKDIHQVSLKLEKMSEYFTVT